jgi:CelD/BcsL family acetyltransferase involved in cellulose biosynthesis
MARMPRAARNAVSTLAPAPSRLEVFQGGDQQWQRFAECHPDATVFHHPAWSRALAAAYGFKATVLMQRDADGTVTAGLPLLEVRRSLRGRRFIALPFTDYCPPLATGPTSLAQLTTGLLGFRQRTRARQLTVHGALPPDPGIRVVTRAVRHVLPLECSPEQFLERLKSTPLPRAIRKAQREGVETRVSRSREDIEIFYRLHLQTRRRLGVPVQPKRFLELVWSHLIDQGLGFVVLATKERQPIAGALYLAWNGTLIYKFGASDPRYWELRPNNLVMWTAIAWGCEHGYRQLDFGRSDLDNPGLRDFKRRWGAAELPLRYSYLAAQPPRSRSGLATGFMTRMIQASPPIVCRALGELLYGRLMRFAS